MGMTERKATTTAKATTDATSGLEEGRAAGRLFLVRPAWADSYGWKSRHKLVTASEVKRNCMRVTECGEEAWSEAACR